MTSTTIFLIIEDSFPIEVGRLADSLQQHLDTREDVFSDTTAKWYWDDAEYGVEYGVRLNFPTIDPEYALEVAREFWRTWLRFNPGREARLELQR